MASQLTLNLVQGSVQLNFSVTAAQQLKTTLAELVQTLKTTAAATVGAGRPKPIKPVEYRHTGDVFLEIFCNPNIWPSPFAAKLLITVRDDRMRLTTEAELTRIIEDVNLYLEQYQ
ncbi:hypothetical protein N836_25280 [Leptolyngbya sp. Heron Island J]|uniref:hypothetical protein n=1 Tax=Leptolyngbya sp. Heron Island J TaxID=1385935 RepID=UPI0003B9795C|nr:hypothetical protein [Leptolyngbya sp. Heron Island J]ESA32630.1 hypothetical protein N836_25280 [Leptolyngbya sp. Heron Island J]